MLPSRLFRNLGIPPRLRILPALHPALAPTVAVQMRLRSQLCQLAPVPPRSNRRLRTSALRASSSTAAGPSSSPLTSLPAIDPSEKAQEQKIDEPRLQLSFTCTAGDCSTRSTHEFTRRSYERGIVIATCPGCKNRHLIADHLGWFNTTEGTEGGTLRTIEEIMRAKGEKVSRGRIDAGGVVEYSE